jgi:hypothetical protein
MPQLDNHINKPPARDYAAAFRFAVWLGETILSHCSDVEAAEHMAGAFLARRLTPEERARKWAKGMDGKITWGRKRGKRA